MKACIAVVDAARARLFTFERRREPTGVVERMTEQPALINPAPRLVPHTDERFAAAVVGELTRDANVERIILCASPRMLGKLRCLTTGLHQPGRVIDELAHEVTKMTAPELRDYLASYGLLPAR